MSEFSENRPTWKRVCPSPVYAAGVSAHTWKRLSIHVGRALQHSGPRSGSQVRRLVPLVIQQMRLVDASWEAIECAVERAVTEHADFGRYNRLNVVSGREESEPLIAWMLAFVHRARSTEVHALAAHADQGVEPMPRSRFGR